MTRPDASAAAGRRRFLLPQWVAVTVVPGVLLAVAAVQGWRVVEHDQSTWSGAGYGMFATYDNEDTRFVTATLTVADGAQRREFVPGELARLAFEARVTPSAERVQHLADQWLARSAREVAAVDVTVWGIELVDRDPALLDARPIRSATASRQDGGGS